ncbi:hypothetical protein, partial [Klebsiella variicola]|uniref:hypothetical protein n=1 Tax=Klebsiella variicola TaxID=244366 RepID=UPI00272F9944
KVGSPRAKDAVKEEEVGLLETAFGGVDQEGGQFQHPLLFFIHQYTAARANAQFGLPGTLVKGVTVACGNVCPIMPLTLVVFGVLHVQDGV